MGIKNNTWASYITKYRKPIVLSAVFNIGYSIFTLISIPLIIPFFQLLFGTKSTLNPDSNALEAFMHNTFQSLIESSGAEKALLKVCLAFVLVIVIRNIFRYLSLYVMAPVRNGIVADIRQKIYSKVFELPISYFTEEKKGDLISKSIADVQEVEWSILNVIEVIFRSPILLLGALTLMIYISPQLTVFVFILVLITVFLLRITSKSLRSISHKAQAYLGNITSIIEESINGVRIIKSYNAENPSKDRFDLINQQYKNTVTKTLRIKDISAPFSETLGMIIVGVLMYLGARLVFQSSLAPESFFAFLFAFYQVIEPSKALSNGYFNIQKGMAAVDRIEGVLNISNDIVEPNQPSNWDSFSNELKFSNVHFNYKNSGNPTLTDINFTVKKGQKVALVGPSGSGKTTLINIICKFFNVSQGSIQIDGHDLQTIPTSTLRKQIGLVTQDPILFNDSIKYNLTLGRPEISDEEIKLALEISNSMEFIIKLPEGLNTLIGDNGIRLSGGQKQRLSIARAIIGQPEILIFDEATSSLDTTSEKLVQEAIDTLSNEKTSIVIAHRLSTIKNADQIVLLNNGKVEAIGDHAALVEQNPLYKQLVQHQFI